MAAKVYHVHVHKEDGKIYTVSPENLPGWPNAREAKTEGMRLVGVAGFECKCGRDPHSFGFQEHIERCPCPCHIVKVIVSEEVVVAAYNGPCRSKPFRSEG